MVRRSSLRSSRDGAPRPRQREGADGDQERDRDDRAARRNRRRRSRRIRRAEAGVARVVAGLAGRAGRNGATGVVDAVAGHAVDGIRATAAVRHFAVHAAASSGDELPRAQGLKRVVLTRPAGCLAAPGREADTRPAAETHAGLVRRARAVALGERRAARCRGRARHAGARHRQRQEAAGQPDQQRARETASYATHEDSSDERRVRQGAGPINRRRVPLVPAWSASLPARAPQIPRSQSSRRRSKA